MANKRGANRMIGQTLGHYRIVEKLGDGGMGVVYRARDTRLDRTVAIKVLRPEALSDPERKRRFEQEAKSASALNHPNIVTIHDIDSAEGVEFIVMEYVDGHPLDRLIREGGLALGQALDYAAQIAAALGAAHETGIVHRDIKPANLIVARQGYVKVVDFGLAKLTERHPWGAEAATEGPTLSISGTSGGQAAAAPAQAQSAPHTREGDILGTVAYMSPEQAEGKPVDSRTDVFALGAVLYEMLTGRRAFQGDSQVSTLSAVLRDSPAPVKTLRPDVPSALERVIGRSLEKNRELRYPTAREMWKELAACQTELTLAAAGRKFSLRRPRVAIPAAVLLLAVLVAAGWFWVRNSRVRWARTVALPQIAQLVEKNRDFEAFRLLRQARQYLPGDPQLDQLQRRLSFAPTNITTTPPGANLYTKPYADSGAEWEFLGASPANILLPTAYLRLRITKDGYEPLEIAVVPFGDASFVLDRQGTAPAGMVRVPGGRFQFGTAPPVELEEYWLDRYEVTNKEFKRFVEAGGYQKREFWKHPFVKGGRTLSWDEAMTEFRDHTGRPGPATWELGAFPEGQQNSPVNGVSWYEAAAYAEFAGKSLPTVYHWRKASGATFFADISWISNFAGKGPAPVGSFQGLGPYGTYDMAGNVKEWCWNASGDRRWILGGAWNEPAYMFGNPEARPPLDRSPTNGFRCARFPARLAETITAAVENLTRDYSKEKPVSDEIFRVYQSIYSYDRTELKPAMASVDTSSPHWRKEKVTFNAAYGNERVIAYLFLPKNAAPPYQAVVYFPGAGALQRRSSEDVGQDAEMRLVEFIIRSGRAMIYPIYKGTYERRVEGAAGPNLVRDRGIQWFKDLGRSLDYLETRSDIDRERLAFYGFSMGGSWGPIFTSLERRFKTSVLLVGGFPLFKRPPEVDTINFAPRSSVPTLMINARDDFVFPVQESQIPMFRLLGTPEKDKRHVVLEGGHMPLQLHDVIKEALDWLDRYLGPVKRR